MIITTTDPITGEHLHNLDYKPFVVEGKGGIAIKIYFESVESRRRYIQTRHTSTIKTADYNH